ncbi:MAG: hypothetical protein NWF09_06625 [Candidatus Bathyarchaeota archaeon]|nr:hypothetical protein [Candidatus Bathyarchaeota archaeon]
MASAATAATLTSSDALQQRLTALETQLREITDILEQVAHDADLLSCNIIRALKHKQQQQEQRQWTWDPTRIRWERDEGFKGPYEKTEDYTSADYKALLADLQAHKGKLTRDGIFYWTFENGATIGRKQVTRK